VESVHRSLEDPQVCKVCEEPQQGDIGPHGHMHLMMAPNRTTSDNVNIGTGPQSAYLNNLQHGKVARQTSVCGPENGSRNDG
jgi:hypothetical protein